MKTDLVVGGYIFNEDKVLLVLHRKRGLWLPLGGHIEENETPDDAIKREAKEEAGLDILLLQQTEIPISADTKHNLATPFYVNVHNVGDHDHCCFFYVCKALNPEEVRINSELKEIRWFTKDELLARKIPTDVRDIGLSAFEVYRSFQR